ncbi:MAG: hypothetical protein D6740_01565 [Alphaproteobacteria bacterium]|nr:MAG: hypothetical protein D6740_01565 [Alphaproteobacteria bacterium]
MESADGSTWSSSTVQPFVFGLVLDEIGEDDSIFAAWRWGLWWMLYSGAVVEVGWRGMATDNSADKKKLNDGGSPGWTTNEWAGAIVRIHGGPGAGEWRRIVSNDASSLTVDRDWVTTHTTSTEYVIVGGKNGRVIPASTTGMSAVQDVARGQNGILYVAQGDTHPIRKVRWNSGAYEYADDATGASFLLQTYDQEKGAVIWRAVNGGSGAVSMAPEGSWTNALSFGSEIGVGGTEMDITGMAVFDGKVAVLKSDSIWMVYNEVPDKLNLDLKAYSLRNGRRPVLMPPYLVFPYGRGVERLYKNLMEDFGPNRSLPMRYQGYFVDGDMLPGLLVMLCDAGDYEAGYRKIKGRSTVWGYRGGGWHALARLPEEIGTHALIAQPWDDGRVLCWVGSTHDVYYMVLPQAMNWLNDPAYITQFGTDAYAAFDAVLVSGWYYAGSKSRSKFWRSVRVFADNISTARQIHVYYQTAEDVSDEDVTRGDRWTYAGTATASNTKITLGVESVRLRLAFVLENGSSGGAQTGSPILYGYSLQYLARVDAADSWTVPFRGSDIAVERSGGRETLQADEAIAQLDTWARQITPLTMRSIWSPFDNKQVIIERPGVQPLWMEGRDAQAYYGSVTILEV